jgi:hypothetical protein
MTEHRDFKIATGSEKCHIVFLTDGEANDNVFYMKDKHGNAQRQNVIVDRLFSYDKKTLVSRRDAEEILKKINKVSALRHEPMTVMFSELLRGIMTEDDKLTFIELSKRIGIRKTDDEKRPSLQSHKDLMADEYIIVKKSFLQYMDPEIEIKEADLGNIRASKRRLKKLEWQEARIKRWQKCWSKGCSTKNLLTIGLACYMIV